VLSINTRSAAANFHGSCRIGVSYWPRSPENTSLRRSPPSLTQVSTLDEPRMCPASRTRTVTPGSNSRAVS
jgi:hypothetical protein